MRHPYIIYIELLIRPDYGFFGVFSGPGGGGGGGGVWCLPLLLFVGFTTGGGGDLTGVVP